MYFYKNASDKKPLFFADNKKIIIDGQVFCKDDINGIKVNCDLGRFFPRRKNLNRIEELVDCPPLLKLTGSIEIITVNGTFFFKRVYRVMEAYMYLKRIYSAAHATYTYRGDTMTYRYNSHLREILFSDSLGYAAVFILNEDHKLDREKIMEIKNDWSRKCGFRPCKKGESCSFNEVLFFNDYDRWLTSYDDSISGLNAFGVIDQCNAYSMQTPDKQVLMVSVYENKAFLLAYALDNDIKLFFCGDKEYYDALYCGYVGISTDYDVIEALCRENSDITVKDIFEDRNMTVEERILKLADKLDINDYFISTGFNGIASLDGFEMMEFSNGYNTENYRIRFDEESFEGLYCNMTQGNSGFDILKADKKLLPGKPYTISLRNIGNSKLGFVFCIRSRELHDIIMDGLRKGKMPVSITDCSLSFVKPEFDTEAPPDQEISTKNTDMYEKISFEMTYQTFLGKYSFLYEASQFNIPNGIAVNKNNIVTDDDKKTVKWALARHALNITFTFKSDVPLKEPLMLMFVPMSNVYGGIAIHKIKSEV